MGDISRFELIIVYYNYCLILQITKKEIDNVELDEDSWKSLKMKFPSIDLRVFERLENAVPCMKQIFKFEGTDLEIVVSCQRQT